MFDLFKGIWLQSIPDETYERAHIGNTP
jgi:hypothetical protein